MPYAMLPDLTPFIAIQRFNSLPAKASQPAGSEPCGGGGNVALKA